MLQRLLRLPERRSCLLLGPRQTGKSTLVQSLLPAKSWQVDLLHHDVFLRYSKDPSLFRLEAEARIRQGVRVIFVDEVQKVPPILDEVHAMIEKHRVRFILTGSSARKLKRHGTNFLAGRAVTRRLYPLTVDEQGGLFDLDRNLLLGSLPAVVTSSDEDAIDILRAYAETYLREEVQSEALVRNLGGFARFLEVAAAQCGDILNYSAVGRDASLATRTVQEYFQILEDTLIGYRLEPWRKSARARLVAHPRFYLFDTGVTNALNRRLTERPDRMVEGRLFEQWVILECVRMIEYLGSEARLYYWRTHVGAEVDLIVENHGRIVLAAEIKSGGRVVGADLTGLRSFGDVHPKVPRVVVSRMPEEYSLGEVVVYPYRRFLKRLGAWLG